MIMSLVITHDCNLRCGYCFTGDKFKKSMTIETGKKAIDFVFKNSQDERVIINFFGGEPVLYFQNIKQLVEHAKEKNREYNKKLEFTVTTNGTIMNEEIAEYFINNKFGFSLSIDGDEATQNKYRVTVDGKGSYELVEKKIKYWLDMQQHGVRITIRMTIDILNCEGLYSSIKYLYETGFRKFAYAPNIHDDWKEDDIQKLKYQYKKIAEYYIEKMEVNAPFSCSNIEKYITGYITKCTSGCDAACNKFAVSPDGNIYPCHAFVKEDKNLSMAIGHIETGFNENRGNFIQTYESNYGCLSCALVKRCANVCPATNYDLFGKINEKHWFSCENERLSIEASDYVGNELFKYNKERFLEHIFGPRKNSIGKDQ